MAPAGCRQVLLQNSTKSKLPSIESRREEIDFDNQFLMNTSGQHFRSVKAAWLPVTYSESLKGYAASMDQVRFCVRLACLSKGFIHAFAGCGISGVSAGCGG